MEAGHDDVVPIVTETVLKGRRVFPLCVLVVDCLQQYHFVFCRFDVLFHWLDHLRRELLVSVAEDLEAPAKGPIGYVGEDLQRYFLEFTS